MSLGQQRRYYVGVQDGKDEENPTKDRDTSAFTCPGIALANDRAIIVCPHLRAELVSDHPSATFDHYTLTSER